MQNIAHIIAYAAVALGAAASKVMLVALLAAVGLWVLTREAVRMRIAMSIATVDEGGSMGGVRFGSGRIEAGAGPGRVFVPSVRDAGGAVIADRSGRERQRSDAREQEQDQKFVATSHDGMEVAAATAMMIKSSASDRSEGSARGDAYAMPRDASLATLAIGLGHDIGNIVLPILCHLDSLEARELPADARVELQALRESTTRLKRLSAGLSLFSHDPSDASATAPATNVAAWWLDVEPVLQNAVSSRMSLRAEIASDLPALRMPPHQLTRAVLSLIVNAAESMRDGGEVRLTARASQHDGQVEIRVTDTGHGMTAAVLRHATDPYFTTKKRELSTGLGLTQVNSLVHSAGGTVTIESHEGRGTTVRMIIPAQHEALWSGEQTAPKAIVRMGDVRLAAYMRALLEGVGYAIAGNGDALLLVVDGDAAGVPAARQFVGRGGGRHAILIGKPNAGAHEPGLKWIESSHRVMQREIQLAANRLHSFETDRLQVARRG